MTQRILFSRVELASARMLAWVHGVRSQARTLIERTLTLLRPSARLPVTAQATTGNTPYRTWTARDLELHRHLETEGQLNLLYRLSPQTPGYRGPLDTATFRPPKTVPFISRAEHLFFRSEWHRGRWARLNWSVEERAAILRQDRLFRAADDAWALRHGRVTGRATLLPFPHSVSIRTIMPPIDSGAPGRRRESIRTCVLF